MFGPGAAPLSLVPSMVAHCHAILSRHREYELQPARAEDFAVGPAQGCDAASIVADPCCSLYCLDAARQDAVFLKTPTGLDLSDSPFYFLAQFQYATHVIRVPIASLHPLAGSLRPRLHAPILVHSVGRCGSTLVSRALGAVPEVCSLSEPDVFTQLTEWRCSGVFPPDELQQLVETCTRIACKPLTGRPSPSHVAVKFRAQCIEIADLLDAAFPAARQLYLTRPPLDWLESALRTLVPLERMDDPAVQRVVEESFASVHPWLREVRDPTQTKPLWKTWTLVWIANTETHRRLCAAGLRFLEIDYAELRTAPAATIRRIFDHCELPLEHWDRVVACLGRDSQEGSRLARSKVAGATRLLPAAVGAEASALLRSRGHVPDGR